MKSTRTLLPLLLLALVALAFAWRSLGSEGEAPSSAPVEPSPSTAASADDDAVELVDEEPALDDELAAGESERGDERTVAGAIAETRARPGPTLLVVDASTRAPIAGARVAWIDEALVRAREPALEIPSTAFQRLAAQDGLALTTDAHGRVALPGSREQAYVEARSSFLAGSLRIRPFQKGELVLELAPADEVFVRVLDADGRPAADVPVGCGTRTGSDPAPAASSRTDADGFACFRDASKAAERRWELLVLLPLAEPVLAVVEGPRTRDDAVVLRLPPTGSVRVVVDGAPEFEPLRTTLRRAPSDSGGSAGASVLTRGVERGVATFERVGLGLAFSIELRAWERTFRRELRANGPTRAGETVDVALSLADLPVVALRLLDEGGAPVAGSFTLELSTETPEDVVAHHRLARASDGGRFEALLPDPLRAGGRRSLRLVAEERLGAALVDLSRAVPPGRTDLGDVRLGDGPLVAEGRVLDARGAPVAGASLVVEHLDDASKWSRDDEPSATTGKDGRFRLLGFPSAQARTLVARKRGLCPSQRRPIAYGERGLELCLLDTGALAGTVLGAKELARHGLGLQARFEGEVEPRDATTDRATYVWRTDAFQLDALRPGPWRLEVVLGKQTVAARALEVRPGATTTAAEIDLRAILRTVVITCVDEQGEPVRGASVSGLLRDASETKLWRAAVPASEPGAFELVTGAAGLDVDLRCEGFETQLLTNVREDRRVVLRRGVPVRVVAAGDEPLREGERVVAVRLVPQGTAARAPSALPIERAFVAGREFDVLAPAEGVYLVQWFVVDGAEDDGRVAISPLNGPDWTPIPGLDERVSIARGESTTRVVVTPPRGALATATEVPESRGVRRQRRLPQPNGGPR